MNLELINSAAGALLSALVNSLVFAAGITAVAWGLCRFVPGINAATRHVIWWAVLGSFAAVPMVLHKFPATKTVDSVIVPIASMAEVDHQAPFSSPPPDVRIQEPAPAANSLQYPVEIRSGYLPLFVVTLWVAILIVQVVRVLSSYVYLSRIKSSSTPAPRQFRLSFDEWMLACRVGRETRLLISEGVESPMAAGFRRPAVIVPHAMANQLAAQDLDHVVLHELAHLARRDDWTNLIARIAAGLFALHPFATWVLRRIDADREIACDDWVVAMTGASKPYALSLARLVLRGVVKCSLPESVDDDPSLEDASNACSQKQ
jgi:beta-lactamase regulating signal transducer with metallopeptidase domain